MKISTNNIPHRILPFLLTVVLAISVSACSSIPLPWDSSPEPEPEIEQVGEETVTEPIALKASHPKQYTVKKGDTLWDISSLFLRDPWYWPEIWHNNQQIKNPHLIYPGDVLTLVYINGQPQITVNPDGSTRRVGGGTYGPNGLPVRVLSPRIHSRSIENSIVSIPGDAIRQFLNRPKVVTQDELLNAPRVVGSKEGRLTMSKDDRIYIRGDLNGQQQRYLIFKPGKELYDPESEDILGYEAIFIANVNIARHGDPSTGDITLAEQEVLIGDRLLAEDTESQKNIYFPRPPEKNIKGQIIALYDALFGVGRHQIVVINRGEEAGLEVGHLLSVSRKGEIIRDRINIHQSEKVQLPDERSGLVMIFKSFDKVSYGLILEATRAIYNHDVVQTAGYE